MAERPEDQAAERRAAERVDRLVGELARGKRPSIGPGDAEHREAILAAARLAGAVERYPTMSPGLRRRLSRLAKQVPGGEPQQRWMSRRAALVGGIGLALGGAVGAVASRIARPSAPSRGQSGHGGILQPAPGLGRWADTGLAASELPEGIPRRVQAGSISAFVVRQAGRVTAVSAICTHLPCELVARSDMRDLFCPCHGQAFTAEGQSESDAYPLPPLPQVMVRVVDGRIEVLGT